MENKIKQQIEEEAHKYGEQCVGDSYVKYKADNGFTAGANFVLSKWQEAERWREVGKDEYPEVNKDILLKGFNMDEPDYDIGYLHTGNSKIFVSGELTEVTHWKPIQTEIE